MSKPVTHRVMRRGVLTVLGAVLTLGGVGMAPAVGAPRVPASTAAKPTVVLVHGAWADSGAWTGEVTRLQADGYPVRVFPAPLRGLGTDAAYLRGYLSSIAGPVILVGHSYGGAVISDAALGLGQVRALVYVDAFAPDKGESVSELAVRKPGSVLAADPTTVFDVSPPYPGAPQDDVDLTIKPAVFVASFANDLPADVAAASAATQRPVAAGAVNEASGQPAWRTIPSWYVIGTRDKVLPPAEQRSMAYRAHSHITSIPAGHLSIVSQPAAISAFIEAAAAGTAA